MEVIAVMCSELLWIRAILACPSKHSSVPGAFSFVSVWACGMCDGGRIVMVGYLSGVAVVLFLAAKVPTGGSCQPCRHS